MNTLVKLLAFISSLSLLMACDPKPDKNLNTGEPRLHTAKCIEQQSACQLNLAEGNVEILFDVERIVAEQAFTMTLNYQGSKTISSISGYLEGEDMFMGKIPLFIEPARVSDAIKDQQTSIAEVMVGSCSSEKMTWRVWLTFTTSSQEQHTKTFTLVSYRY